MSEPLVDSPFDYIWILYPFYSDRVPKPLADMLTYFPLFKFIYRLSKRIIYKGKRHVGSITNPNETTSEDWLLKFGHLLNDSND